MANYSLSYVFEKLLADWGSKLGGFGFRES